MLRPDGSALEFRESASELFDDLNARFGLRQVVVTNSVPQTPAFRRLPVVTVRCPSDTLARTINRIHHNRSVSEVFYRA